LLRLILAVQIVHRSLPTRSTLLGLHTSGTIVAASARCRLAPYPRWWNEQTMSKQNPILKRTTSAMCQAIRMFMVGTDGIAGTALVEVAIIAPVIIIMIICLSDVGLFAFRQMEVQHAAQAGAQYASKHAYNSSSISSAVQHDATFTISAAPAPSQFCACPTATGLTNAGTPPCTSTCTGGGVAGTYVTVSAQATYNAVVVTSFLGSSSPFSASSHTLTASATVRTE
jgi:Flp pilus assembly protein TadG